MNISLYETFKELQDMVKKNEETEMLGESVSIGFNDGVVIRLRGLTKKAKKIIKKHGEEFTLFVLNRNVPAFQGRSGMWVEAVNGRYKGWLLLENFTYKVD